MNYRIALDGPSGAGKSTIAKRLSAELGFVYVDTGAMYRTVGLYCLQNNVDINDEAAVGAVLGNINIELKYIDGEQRILLNGTDVSKDIRLNEVSMAASKTSAYKAVRAFLLDAQRNVAKTQSVIMDGRDIGTVVLPDAEIKIFIVGDATVRAKRRHKELQEKGQNISLQEVLEDIITRDHNDTNRAEAPLKQAKDAVLLDTTYKNFDEAYEAVLDIVKSKMAQ
ncbi:MAG: (d)CMP kinase [Oscillospiraceae bacterium]|nr:(d)CMP kinase [Oscillospiraceae bacterium]MBP1553457.1 (d)CMP kinase [Oscillospiraceae bacterium]